MFLIFFSSARLKNMSTYKKNKVRVPAIENEFIYISIIVVQQNMSNNLLHNTSYSH